MFSAGGSVVRHMQTTKHILFPRSQPSLCKDKIGSTQNVPRASTGDLFGPDTQSHHKHRGTRGSLNNHRVGVILKRDHTLLSKPNCAQRASTGDLSGSTTKSHHKHEARVAI